MKNTEGKYAQWSAVMLASPTAPGPLCFPEMVCELKSRPAGGFKSSPCLWRSAVVLQCCRMWLLKSCLGFVGLFNIEDWFFSFPHQPCKTVSHYLIDHCFSLSSQFSHAGSLVSCLLDCLSSISLTLVFHTFSLSPCCFWVISSGFS